jgi:2-amino-4-hydroxy-6-hydroxymethyldihydropteridine diphosphokinase
MAPASVFLGLGSNVGDRDAMLDRAMERLAARAFRLTGSSSRYETEPVGGPPQDWYLNMVVRGETRLSPEDLLVACLEIERELGRVRALANGPRSLDVDILLYGDAVRNAPTLTLPHPRLHQRLFVLVPLSELDPDARHPLLGLTAAQLRERCPDTSRVAPRVREPARS